MLRDLVELEAEQAPGRVRRRPGVAAAARHDVIDQFGQLLVRVEVGALQLGLGRALAQQVSQHRQQVAALQLQRGAGMLASKPFEEAFVDQRQRLGRAVAVLLEWKWRGELRLPRWNFIFIKLMAR